MRRRAAPFPSPLPGRQPMPSPSSTWRRPAQPTRSASHLLMVAVTARLRPPRATAALGLRSALRLGVADPIDRAGPVVGHEDRAVLGEDDVVGTAEIALIAFDPALGEDFLF